MQTPVRFYITQNEDQPVVRTIPVNPQVVEPEARPVREKDAPAVTERVPSNRVASLVRSAVRRSSATTK
jgi:hypothetical protein